MDISFVIVSVVLIIHLIIFLIYKLFCKDPKPNNIKNYPDYIIGGEYFCKFISDNPFEKNIITKVNILDLKENHKGETYVKYAINMTGEIQITPIDDFADYYKPVNNL